MTNINELGWVLEGNLLQLDFSLKDSDGNLIAVVGKKMLSFQNKYFVDLYQTDHEDTVILILVALQHMLSDRLANSSGASSGSNNA